MRTSRQNNKRAVFLTVAKLKKRQPFEKTRSLALVVWPRQPRMVVLFNFKIRQGIIMSSKTSNELIASVPYAEGKSIDYYEDRIVFNNKEIFYEDITGYGYLLSTLHNSINLIPTANSKTVELTISTGNDDKPILFKKKVEMPFWFHSKKQADLDIIFSEIVKITDAVLAQHVVNELYRKVRNGETLDIGGLIIEEDSIRRKGTFKEKELDEYGRTLIHAGHVFVMDGQDKQFFSMSLGAINAPLLGSLLDALFRE